jgi:hypothetical protein
MTVQHTAGRVTSKGVGVPALNDKGLIPIYNILAEKFCFPVYGGTPIIFISDSSVWESMESTKLSIEFTRFFGFVFICLGQKEPCFYSLPLCLRQALFHRRLVSPGYLHVLADFRYTKLQYLVCFAHVILRK